MSVLTLFGFLFGRRDAIEKVADTKAAVWLGLLFVFSAGLAREYDGEDLLSEPWHLGIPLVASLATSLLLFTLICTAGGISHWRIRTFLNEYRRFLGLYWMTAPLAWLYGLPVERWMSAGDAMSTNLILLGLVALWRVVLMIRIVSVIYSTRWYTAMFLVLFFADTVMLTLLYYTPLPVVSMMGGVRLSESEQVIQTTSLLARIIGIISWWLWCILTVVVIGSRRLQAYESKDFIKRSAVGTSAWALGALAMLVWIPILPQTQPEQQLRHAVEYDLKNGQIERALATMSEHDRTDFPPHWDPPPRVGYGENEPPLLDLLDVVIENDTSGWVRQEFERKFEDLLGDGDYSFSFWAELDNEEFDSYLNVMEQLPLSQKILDEHRDALRSHVSFDEVHRTEEQIARLHQLLDLPVEEVTSVSPNEKWQNIDRLKGWTLTRDFSSSVKKAHLTRHPRHDSYIPVSEVSPLTEEEAEVYDKLNGALHDELRRVSKEHFANMPVPSELKREHESYFTPFTYQNYDWFGPSYECYIVVIGDYVTPELLSKFQSLIDGEHRKWCVRVVVSESTDFDNDHEIAIFSDQVIVPQEAVNALGIPED